MEWFAVCIFLHTTLLALTCLITGILFILTGFFLKVALPHPHLTSRNHTSDRLRYEAVCFQSIIALQRRAGSCYGTSESIFSFLSKWVLPGLSFPPVTIQRCSLVTDSLPHTVQSMPVTQFILQLEVCTFSSSASISLFPPYDLANFTHSCVFIWRKNMLIRRDSGAPVLIAALFTFARIGKQPRDHGWRNGRRPCGRDTEATTHCSEGPDRLWRWES